MVKQFQRSTQGNNAELAYETPTGNRSKARYVISSKRKLQVELSNGAEKRQYTIDLLAMAPRSKRLKEKTRQTSKTDRKLILGLALAVAAVIAVLLTRMPLLYSGIVAAVITMLMVYLVTRKRSGASRRRKQVFVSRRAQVPLVEITYSKQSKKLEQFVELLEQRIEAAMAACELDEKELLAGELRALRRLAENGILRKRAYEKAKRYLLAKTS